MRRACCSMGFEACRYGLQPFELVAHHKLASSYQLAFNMALKSTQTLSREDA